MSDLPELKPCPWCGKEQTIKDFRQTVPSWMTRNDPYDKHFYFDHDCTNGEVFETEAEAIAAWNLRADLAPVIGREDLIEMLGGWIESEGIENLTVAYDVVADDILDRIKGVK